MQRPSSVRPTVLLTCALALGSCAQDALVAQVTPDHGPVVGGTTVEIRGRDFTPRTRVFFGPNLARDVEFVSEDLLRVTTPRVSAAADVDVRLLRGNKELGALQDGFRFEGGIPLMLDHVQPERIGTDGGWVTMVGDGFTRATEVQVGGRIVDDYEWEDEQLVRVLVPPLSEGQADVSISAPGVDRLLVDDVLTVRDPYLELHQLTPTVGPASGGTVVDIIGEDFTPATQVWFGERLAHDVTWHSSEALAVVAPAGFVGTADVRLTDPTREETLLVAGWQWEQDSDMVVVEVSPAEASLTGGAEIEILGTGFEPGSEVWFGDRRAQAVTVDHAGRMTAILPPATEAGHVDVEVRLPTATQQVLASGFTYGNYYAAIGQAPPPPADEDPWVVGAVSTAFDKVVVSFSEPMNPASAENVNNYSIFGDLWASSHLNITGASLSADGRQVTLTTMAQSEMTYTVVASGVLSAQSEPLAMNEPLAVFNVAEFPGTPESGTPTDTDGDGLSDADEQRGLEVEVSYVYGGTALLSFSSDPTKTDTDLDGLSDFDEFNQQSSPRMADTDLDGLSDADEMLYLADPVTQDTDGDNLPDGDEVSLFLTSPTLIDTDGDGYDDWDEIVVRNRLPRIADLPSPTFTLGQIDLGLDVRYTYTDATGTSRTSDETFETSLTNRNETNSSSSTSHTHAMNLERSQESSVEVGVSKKVGLEGVGVSVEAESSFGMTAGISNEFGFASEESSTAESTETSNRVASFSSTVDATSEVTQETLGASIVTDITFEAASDVAFTVSNIELSLMRRDNDDPSLLVPVATLSPSDPDMEITLGPSSPVRGPFIFTNTEVFPSVVEDLLANPHSMVVRVANYDITDEDGRNLAFVSQDVAERTAEIVIDYGDGTSETYNLATSNGFDPTTRQPLGLDVADGLMAIGLNRNDTVIGPGVAPPAWTDGTYGIDNGALYRVEEVFNVAAATPIPSSVPDVSDSCPRPPGVASGASMSKRIRTDTVHQWVVFHDDEELEVTSFDQVKFTPGNAYLLAYTSDADGDGMFAVEEDRAGSSDLDVDTDDDCLSDWEEVRGMQLQLPLTTVGNNVQIWRDSLVVSDRRPSGYRATSMPNRADSDGDCLRDDFEVAMLDAARAFGTGYVTTTPPYVLPQALDPKSADTDRDGLSDLEEIAGWSSVPHQATGLERWAPMAGGGQIASYLDGVTTTYKSIGASLWEEDDSLCPKSSVDFTPVIDPSTFRTDPWAADSDGDTLPDGREAALDTNPLVADLDGILDEDADGLVAREEPVCSAIDPLLTPQTDADTDNDGLADYLEIRDLGTNPCVADSDADGLSDLEEWDGILDPFHSDECERFGGCFIPVASGLGLGTDPMAYDTDGDGLGDGDELEGWSVTLTGAGDTVGESILVTSDPLDPDSDNDGFVDGIERDGCTGAGAPYAACLDVVPPGLNPNDADTDSDGTSDWDEIFLNDGTDHRVVDKLCTPLRRDPLTPDVVADLQLFELYDVGKGHLWRAYPVQYRAGDLYLEVIPTFGDAQPFADHAAVVNWTIAEPSLGLDKSYTEVLKDCTQDYIDNAYIAAWPQDNHFTTEGDTTHRAVLPVGDSLTLKGTWGWELPNEANPRCSDRFLVTYRAEWHLTGEQFTVSSTGTGQEWRTVTSGEGVTWLTNKGQSGFPPVLEVPDTGMRFVFTQYAGSEVPRVPAGYKYFKDGTCLNPPALPPAPSTSGSSTPGVPPALPGDADGDGYASTAAGGTDCNDQNAGIHPGALEVCDGVDQNCNGAADEGLPFTSYYVDADMDGHGAGLGVSACSQPAGYALVTGDCDDTNAAIRPGVPEVCNGVDDDCDLAVDEGLPLISHWSDGDGDGYGAGAAQQSCSVPTGRATKDGDCNDGADTIHPLAPEYCNTQDDDCDGQVDENAVNATAWYADADGDGFHGGAPTMSCAQPAGMATPLTDCDETNAAINPSATEACDGIDNDCTGAADDGPNSDGDSRMDVCDHCPFDPTPVGAGSTCPAESCEHVKNEGDTTLDGTYWLDPTGTAVQAYCDLNTDGGGWTRVLSYEVTDDSFVTLGAQDATAGLSASAGTSGHVGEAGLADLRTQMGFTEVRLYCTKPDVGRTFHIKTSDTSVIDYLTGATAVLPDAPGSFTTLTPNNSVLASRPADWGGDGGATHIGKWGASPMAATADRLTSHTAYIHREAHWLLNGSDRQECDDFQTDDGTDNNGTWHIFVR